MNTFTRKFHSRKGFTLMELLVAIAVLVILVVGIGYVMTSAMNVYDQSLFESDSAILSDILNTSLGDLFRYSEDIRIGSTGATSYTYDASQPIADVVDSAYTLHSNSFSFSNFDYGVLDGYLTMEDGHVIIKSLRDTSYSQPLVNEGSYADGIIIKDLKVTYYPVILDNDDQVVDGGYYIISYTIAADGAAAAPTLEYEICVRMMNAEVSGASAGSRVADDSVQHGSDDPTYGDTVHTIIYHALPYGTTSDSTNATIAVAGVRFKTFNYEFRTDTVSLLSAGAASRDGYVLAGWTTQDGTLVGVPGAVITAPAQDLNVYAYWLGNARSLSVTVKNGATVTLSYSTAISDNTITLTSDSSVQIPSKSVVTYTVTAPDGNTSTPYARFNGTEQAATGTFTMPDGGATFTAVAGYQVTFQLNDSDAKWEDKTTADKVLYYYETPITVPVPVKSGYDVKEWISDPSTVAAPYRKSTDYTPTGDVVLKAEYTPYSVNYYGNPSTNQRDELLKSEEHSAIKTLYSPSYDGWYFLGWYDAPSGGNCYSTAAQVINATNSASLDLFGRWVSFDANTGTLASKSLTHTGLAITLPNATKDGSTLLGWFTAQTNGTYAAYANATYTISTWRTMLHARWLTVSKTDAVTGETLGTPEIDQSTGSFTLPGATTTDSNYKFVGWWSSKDNANWYQGPEDRKVAPTANITIYPRWVSFQPSIGEALSITVAVNEATGAIVLPDVTWNGYAFHGWWTALEGGSQVLSNSILSAPATVLYTRWQEREICFTYSTQGEGKVVNAANEEITVSDAIKAVNGTASAVTAVPGDNYHFVHWIDSTGAVVSTNETFTPSKTGEEGAMAYVEMTYTAVFAADEYTLTVVAANGTVSPSNTVAMPYGSKITTSNSDGRIVISSTSGNTIVTVTPNGGYVFHQWDKSYSGQDVTGDMTITASFLLSDNTITYVNTDGKGTTTSAGYTAHGSVTLANPTRAGYKTVTWKVTTADGSWAKDATYTGGQTVQDCYGNPTLTAVWTAEVYKVTVKNIGSSGWIGDHGTLVYNGTSYGSGKSAPSINVYGGTVVSASGNTLSFSDVNGNTCTFTAKPYDGILVDYNTVWKLSELSGGNTVTSNCTIYVDFTTSSVYTVSFEVDDLEMGYVDWKYVEVYSGATLTKSDNTIKITKSVDGDVTVTAIPNQGYKFKGWGTMPSSVSQSVSVKANFEKESYTVTVAAPSGQGSVGTGTSGGSASKSVTGVPYGTAVTVDGNKLIVNNTTLYAAANTGYVFDHWEVDGKTISNGYLISGAVTITAVYKDDYSLTLNANGGTVEGKSSVVKYGTVTLPDPTWEGHKFLGWYTDATAGNKITETQYTPVVNTTLYAHWEILKVTLTLSGGEGTLTGYTGPYTLDYGTQVTLSGNTLTVGTSTVTANSGNSSPFSGWKNKSGTLIKETFKLKETTTLTATFGLQQFNVSFDTNGDGTAEKKVAVESGTELAVSGGTITWGTNTVTAAAKTGYTFSKWTVGTADVGTSYTVSADVTLKANYSANEYTITYVYGNGQANTTAKYTIEKAVTLAAAPTRTGWEFKGWKVTSSVTNSGWNTTDNYSAGASVAKGNYGDVTFTAQWSPLPYTLTVTNAGGTGGRDSQSRCTFTYGGQSYSNGSSVTVTVHTGATISVSNTVLTVTDTNWTNSPVYTFTAAKSDSNDRNTTIYWYTPVTTITGDTTVQLLSKAPYTLTISGGDHGTVSDGTNSGQSLSYVLSNGSSYTVNKTSVTFTDINGTARTVTAAASTGYSFSQWDAYSSSYYSNNTHSITSDTTITAKYNTSTYTVTIQTADDSKGRIGYYSYSTYDGYRTYEKVTIDDVPYDNVVTIDGKKIVVKNSSNDYYAVPNDNGNYVFDHWSVNDNAITNGYKIPGAVTIEANFRGKDCAATVSATTGGKVSTSSFTAHYGDTISVSGNTVTVGSTTITATANEGYDFTGWTGNTSGTVTGTISLQANFKQQTFSLSATAGSNGSLTTTGSLTAIPYGSTVSISSNVLTVKNGSTTIATITANPSTGYNFGAWSGLANGDVIKSNVSVSASFNVQKFKVTLKSGGNGSVKAESVADVPYGTVISVDKNKLTINGTTVTATANTHYHFTEWTGLPTSNKVTGDVTITANFAIDTFTVTIAAGDNGSVEPTSVTGVPYGTAIAASGNQLTVNNKTVTATASANYHFDKWTNLPTDNKVTANVTVKALFTIDTYSLTISAGENGYLNIGSDETHKSSYQETVPYGTTVAFSTDTATITKPDKTTVVLHAKANPGYEFVSWSNSGTVTVTGTTSLSCSFRQETVLIRFEIADGRGYLEPSIAEYRITKGSQLNFSSDSASYKENGCIVTFNDYNSQSVKVTAMSNNGYRFNYWKIYIGNEEVQTIKGVNTYTVSNAITLKGSFYAKKYSIKYDANGGNPTPADTEYYVNKPFTLAAAPERVGYTFKNWKVEHSRGSWNIGATYAAGKTFDSASEPMYDYPTLIAQWTPVNYTITYEYSGGTEKTAGTTGYTIEKGITLPVLEKAGHTFAGWTVTTADGNWTANDTISASTTAIAAGKYGNVKLTAKWTVNSYTVTWMNEGTKIYEESVEYGKTPEYNTAMYGTPTKDATAQYTYTFSNWNPSISTVTGDITYYAQFSSTVNKYTVTFKNWDDKVLQSTVYEYGDTPSYSGTPTRDSTVDHTYTFNGWDNTIAKVTGPATYKAQYTEAVRTYTVIFYDDDGKTELKNSKVAYGETPTCDNPKKDSTDEFDYTFSGWTPAVVAVKGDAEYKAQYTSSKRSYTVTFYDDDRTTVLKSGQVAYGEMPTCDDPPQKSNDQFTYTFSKWDPSISAVTGAINYYAQYSSTVNKYTVTFENWDGKVLQSKEYEYGDTPSYSGTPTRDSTVDHTYTFNGWDNTIAEVTGPATYKAQYTEAVRTYTVIFYDDDGKTELKNSKVAYGETPTCDKPTKDSTDEFDYTFSAWTPTVVAVNGDAEYVATYTAVTRTYDVTVTAGTGGTVDTATVQAVPYGSSITVSKNTITVNGTTVTATANGGYYFSKWGVSNGTKVEGDTKINATFLGYKVTYNANNGVLLDANGEEKASISEIYNGSLTLPVPTRSGYRFDGWTATKNGTDYVDESTEPTANVTYYAHWTQLFTVTVVSNDENMGSVDINSVTDVPKDSVVTVEKNTITINDTTITATAEPGYKFSKWSGVSDGSTITKSVNVTAKFVGYTVKYQANGGNLVDSSGNSVTSISEKYSGALTLPEPTREGYRFDGWFTKSSSGSQVKSDTIPSSNVTYYAHWTQLFTVTVVSNDENMGSVDINSVTDVPKDSVVTVEKNTITINDTTITATAEPGYKFSKWSVSNNATITKATEVTATFVGNTVTFDANGGSMTSSSGESVTSITETFDGSLTVYVPTRDGCQFAGWYTAANGGDKVEIDAETVPTSDVTYYAHWNVTLTVKNTGGTTRGGLISESRDKGTFTYLRQSYGNGGYVSITVSYGSTVSYNGDTLTVTDDVNGTTYTYTFTSVPGYYYLTGLMKHYYKTSWDLSNLTNKNTVTKDSTVNLNFKT